LTRSSPWTISRIVPSGTRNMRWTTAIVPMPKMSSGVGSSVSGFLLVNRPMMRGSASASASSIKRTERAWPTVNGSHIMG